LTAIGHKPTVANGRFATGQHDCARPASEAIGLRTPPPPTIDYDMALFARGGGLLGYGPDGADMYRRAARYVDAVLKGTRVGDLPTESPSKVRADGKSLAQRRMSAYAPRA